MESQLKKRSLSNLLSRGETLILVAMVFILNGAGLIGTWEVLAQEAPLCHGKAATIHVDGRKIVGGPDNGKQYMGVHRGTSGDDVIVGTSGDI